MGAWGRGLLQNDTAQDGLVQVIDTIEDDIAALADHRPDEGVAARLGAAVGLLLQLSSWYSFDPEKEVFAMVVQAIERQKPKFTFLPCKAGQLLRDVGDGKGKDLTIRPGKLSRSLQRALFASPSDDFPTERVFGKREPSLFAHPKAARYVQEVAKWCVARIDEDFKEEDIVGDLTREAEGMGAFGTLLVIEPCSVPVKMIERWRNAYHEAVAEIKAEGELDEFEKDYEKCLELAFRLMIKKFSP